MPKNTGHRLTENDRNEIRNAPAEMTLAELAKKYNTSMNTVQRYRSRKAAPTKAAAEKARTPAIARSWQHDITALGKSGLSDRAFRAAVIAIASEV